MDIKILTKNLPGGEENEAFKAVIEGADLDISQYPPGIYVSERYAQYEPYDKLDAFNMHIVDNNGKVRTLYSAGRVGLYELYAATTTDNPKLTKQEYANQITQLYKILKTI